MGRRRLDDCPLPRIAIALILCSAVPTSGCALLIPPSWRGHAPVPLAGPIDPESLDGPGPGDAQLATVSDAQLRARIDADRQRLVELASRTGAGPAGDDASEAELRAIADRLPRMQRELTRRQGGASDANVIR